MDSYTNGYGHGHGQGQGQGYGYSQRDQRDQRDHNQPGYASPSGERVRSPVNGTRSGRPRPAPYDPPPADHSAAGTNGSSLLRPTDLERKRANRRSGEFRSRSYQGNGRAVQQIDDVLYYMKREWGFMTGDECVPVKVALQLMDPSSLGLATRYAEFQKTEVQLQNALRAIVNEHHQGFNSSIGTFHQIQASIQASHDRVRTLRDSLVEARANLTVANPEHKSLAGASHTYMGMLEILGMIEELQQVPEKLEACISEKRFLAAVDLLQDALRLSKKSELEDIGALSDLKVYLSNQEHSLTDILKEELHNHLYLKSPYCEDRWRPYAKQSERGNAEPSSVSHNNRTMYAFLETLDTSEALTEDTSRNPEADSFHYIYVLAEALQKLGRVEDAVNDIEERLPVELFKVVDRSSTEMQQKHPSTLHAEWKHRKASVDIPLGTTAQNVVLTDLLYTIYAKFEAIAESHRVLHEIIAGLTKRDTGTTDRRLTRSFKELWKLYQSEMRSLLHDYLSARGSAAERLAQGAGEGNVFRYQRDKSKKCTFRMDLIDASSADVRNERDEVVSTWQKFVPGLASLSQATSASASASQTSKQLDNSAAGHKLLVEPSVFNIGFLLPPSVSFLGRLKEIVPPASDIVVSTLTSFLNDFLINVFQPQLEETLTEYCAQSFNQLDAFQQDPQWSLHARRPVFRGAVRFFNIVLAFSRMLVDLTHDQMFSHLVITQMNSYYDKCNGWYKALVTRAQAATDGRKLKAAAFLAESSQVADVMTRLAAAEDEHLPALISEESQTLIQATRSTALEEADLIGDKKAHAQLCLLHNTMTWLASKMDQLRHISDRANDSFSRRDSNMPPPRLQRSLTNTLPDNPLAGDEPAYLPLNPETAGLFDGVVTGLREIATLALRTLHLELRCHIVYALAPRFQQQSYLLREPVEAADEEVVTLVNDMLAFDREIKAHLQPQACRFVTTGYSHLVDTIIVGNIMQSVRAMNARGAEHIEINAHVLYHNLLNIESQADLPRTFELLQLFASGPNAIVAQAWKRQLNLTFEELRTLMELTFSEARESQDEAASTRAEKEMSDQMVALSEAIEKSG